MGVTLDGLLSGALGVALGAFFPVAWEALRRRTERRGELNAMHVEFRQGIQAMNHLLGDKVKAPLYRVAVSVIGTALPKLIGEGALTLNETGALVEYLNRAQELNRGLDRAGDAHAAGNRDLLDSEYLRNIDKAAGMLRTPEPRFDDRSLVDAAHAAVFRLQETYGESRRTYWFGTFSWLR